MISNNLPVLIPLTFLVTAILIIVLGSWRRFFVYPLAILGTAFSFVVSLYGTTTVLSSGTIRYHIGGWIPPIGIEYVLDPFSACIATIVCGVALLVFIHSRVSVESELPEKVIPFYAIAMLLLLGLTGIVVTGDLFNLYVFLEISALSSYAIVSVGEKRAPVAAFRYLLIGTIGATFYLLGIGYIYLLCGSLNMADVSKLLAASQINPALVVGIVLMIAGIGLKMALFPMHGWLPDAYSYAPSSGSALLAPIGTKVAAYALIRVVVYVFPSEYIQKDLPILDILAWLSAAGILYGSVMAIAQSELKRMLAYSSIAQIGYIGLGIGLGNALGFIGAILHILNHALMKATLFLVAGNLRLKIGHSSLYQFESVIGRKLPWTAAAFTLAALSMIGIPPTAGFFSKWYLVLAGIEESQWFFVAVILISSLLNAVYFFRVLEKMYLHVHPKEDNTEMKVVERDEVPASMLIPTLVFAGLILLFGLFNVAIIDWIIKPMILGSP